MSESVFFAKLDIAVTAFAQAWVRASDVAAEKPQAPKAVVEPVAAPAKTQEPAKTEAPKTEPAKLSVEQVRKNCLPLLQAAAAKDKPAAVALLAQYKAKKLSEVADKDIEEFCEELKGLLK